MMPVAYIEHQLPGRMRLRIPSMRGEVPFFERVVRELSGQPAIRELNASPLTGSITLQYLEPLQEIIAAAADKGLFETRRLESRSRASESKRTAGFSEGPGLMEGTAVGLSGLGLFQIAQGNVLGSAAESLWHAFGAQRILGRPDVASVFAVLGVYQVLRGRLFGSASSLLFYGLVMHQLAALEQARARSRAVATAGTKMSITSGIRVGGGSNASSPPSPACGGEGREEAGRVGGGRHIERAGELSS
jgi:hypothetical protein